jgi:hypothetical protein
LSCREHPTRGRDIANKKFVVKLDGEERKPLDALITKGKASAKLILKACILLKADQGQAGEGWSDVRCSRAYARARPQRLSHRLKREHS